VVANRLLGWHLFDLSQGPGEIEMKSFTLALAVIAMTVGSTPAAAESLTSREVVGWLRQGGDIEKLAKVSINSYFDSMLWANTYVHKVNDIRIYCQPQKLAINGEQAAAMFRKYLDEHPEHLDKPVGFVVLLTLKDTFPCE